MRRILKDNVEEKATKKIKLKKLRMCHVTVHFLVFENFEKKAFLISRQFLFAFECEQARKKVAVSFVLGKGNNYFLQGKNSILKPKLMFVTIYSF